MKTFITLSLLLVTQICLAQFPKITQGDYVENDKRFNKEIIASKAGELTIASFNIRNLGTRGRTLNDYIALVDLVDEADIIVFQEVGLGAFRKDAYGPEAIKMMNAVTSIIQSFLGDNWVIVKADNISPNEKSAAAELGVMAYRKSGNGITITGKWKEYADIGDKRDMAVYDMTVTKDGKSNQFYLGSIHTSPDCPHRDEQLLGVAEWTKNQTGDFIVAGDFNWGYSSNKCKDTYVGENMMNKLHDDGKVFQVFHELSYEKKPSPGDLRTNLGIRATARFYDQFLTSKNFSTKMAEGGKFMQDCGIRSYSQDKNFKKIADKYVSDQMKGLNTYAKNKKIETNDVNWIADKAQVEEKLLKTARAHGTTWRISDHRVVWMKLKF